MERMKALKSFRVGETDSVVAPGSEFECSNNSARNYESRGMAVRIRPMASARRGEAKTVENKAAQAGPLDSPGGEIGGEIPPSSSPADPARRKYRSKNTEGGLDL